MNNNGVDMVVGQQIIWKKAVIFSQRKNKHQCSQEHVQTQKHIKRNPHTRHCTGGDLNNNEDPYFTGFCLRIMEQKNTMNTEGENVQIKSSGK